MVFLFFYFNIMKKKIVIKIWTSTLTWWSNKISYSKIEDIAKQIVELTDIYHIILVSSWAIATAKQFTNIKWQTTDLPSKQALSAIWQPKLMHIYDEVFESYWLSVAQALLTHTDFTNENSIKNTNNTISKLLEMNYIPIINENDTVATDEIKLWDNDKLSALVAKVINADLLIIASDIDGLYNDNPHLNKNAKLIKKVIDLDEIKDFIKEKHTNLWTWWMKTKIDAAKICQDNRINMRIINWWKNNFIADAINNKIEFTKFKFRK